MNWWHRLWRRKQMEEQLDKELRFHLEQHTADLIARGHAPEEARRRARLLFGGPEQVKEECRDARGTRWLEDLWQDFRYALRTLRQRPGFAAVALLTLALGSGATTVMFTVINGVLLKPLPYPAARRLVAVHGHTGLERALIWRAESGVLRFSRLPAREPLAWTWRVGSYNGGTMSDPGTPSTCTDSRSRPTCFPSWVLRFFAGALSCPKKTGRAARRWRSSAIVCGSAASAASPAALGRPLVLDGKRYTIVGIAPASFRLDGDEADVFTPLGQNTAPFHAEPQAASGWRDRARCGPARRWPRHKRNWR